MNEKNLKTLKPAFDFTSNKSITSLYKGKAEITYNNKSYKGNGEVTLELLPTANIYIKGYFQGISMKDAMNLQLRQTKIQSFSINGHKIDGIFISAGGDANSQELNIKWCPRSEPINVVGHESTQLTKIVFHLFNFESFIGERRSIEKSGDCEYGVDHLDLVYDEWEIQIKSLRKTHDNITKLNAEGGCLFTHVGALQKTDSQSFSGKQASDLLIALRYFLTFATGCWCEPICSVGFDESENRLWESWSSPRGLWQEFLTWYDPQHSSDLVSFFPCFMEHWKDENWQIALKEIIYWYQNAKNPSTGIESGIILTQAAIERLSYEYSVKEKTLLTSKGFKALWASDKFRLLFSSLDIPLGIPNQKSEMIKAGKEYNWIDAPHALTEIRNSLIHPDHKKNGQLNSTHIEAWDLALWYLEMGVLAICNYSGTYLNRLEMGKGGRLEKVPWLKT